MVLEAHHLMVTSVGIRNAGRSGLGSRRTGWSSPGIAVPKMSANYAPTVRQLRPVIHSWLATGTILRSPLSQPWITVVSTIRV